VERVQFNDSALDYLLCWVAALVRCSKVWQVTLVLCVRAGIWKTAARICTSARLTQNTLLADVAVIFKNTLKLK